MPIAVAVWSFTLQPGEPQEFVPPSDVVITNIALGDKLEDEKSRTTVKLTYLSPVNVNDSEDEDENDDEGSGGTVEETVLCSLTPGKIEQATTNITLEGEEEYLLQAIGKNTIYLTGNYIDQSPDNVPYNDDSEPEDEDDFDLREVSSDVELDPMDMAGIEEDDDDEEEEDSHRFEEVPDETEPPSKKRARESNASPSDEKLSKAQDKKAKKQKTVNGEAVPTASSTEPGQESEKKDKKDKKKKKEKKGEEKSDGKTSSTKELAGGLKITDVKVGDGPQAKPGQKLSMRYIGKLQNGKIFDQNTKGKPFEFNLGRGEVIKGWDEGLKGMHVGGERLLVIPPGMAYGKQKQQGIPANSTLTFEVKLIGSK